MNLFRSEEHVKRWPLYIRAAEDYVMPVADWARVFAGPLFRRRLEPGYLDHSEDYLIEYHDDLHELGKASPFWQYPLIEAMDTISLSRYRVVGNYSRFDDPVLNDLKDARNGIVAGLESKSPHRENHLVWAAPGSGKTYLVQEIARAYGDGCEYVEINLAKQSPDSLREALESLVGRQRPVLCLVDEVDAHAGTTWPYEVLMPHLDVTVEGRAHVVFVLAGSSGFSLEGMKQGIASRPKGNDVLSRLPNDNQFMIPPMSFGDRVLIVIAQMQMAGAELGYDIRAIEKLGLYYAAVNAKLANARQLQEFAARAVARVPPGDDRVKYDQLFSPGDPENKRFWLDVSTAARGLVNSYVRIDDTP